MNNSANIMGQERNVTKVMLGENQLNLVVAQTKEEKIQGLSGLDKMPLDGMLFVINPKAQPKFWMLDMKIPIDIIWIADNVVVKIDRDVPAEPGVAKTDLKTYTPPVPVDTVIELGAGQSQSLGIAIGADFRKNN